MNRIENLKREAKFLKKDFDKGDDIALNRVRKHFHNLRVTLMNCQFIIAKEQGFKNWSDLLEQWKEDDKR